MDQDAKKKEPVTLQDMEEGRRNSAGIGVGEISIAIQKRPQLRELLERKFHRNFNKINLAALAAQKSRGQFCKDKTAVGLPNAKDVQHSTDQVHAPQID